MQITGMLHGARLLKFAGHPAAEVLGPSASEDEIKALIGRHGTIFVKPVFKGGVGKKGKAGLIGRATTLQEALAEKERLYFAQHRAGDVILLGILMVAQDGELAHRNRSGDRHPAITDEAVAIAPIDLAIQDHLM